MINLDRLISGCFLLCCSSKETGSFITTRDKLYTDLISHPPFTTTLIYYQVPFVGVAVLQIRTLNTAGLFGSGFQQVHPKHHLPKGTTQQYTPIKLYKTSQTSSTALAFTLLHFLEKSRPFSNVYFQQIDPSQLTFSYNQ